MRLIEPLGLLHGRAAREAIDRGVARPLAGGPAAFSLARLEDGSIVPVAALLPDTSLGRTTARRPPFAALPREGPWIMGILNVTPDSFSDGDRHPSPESAIAAGLAMCAAGADIVDVGGESTRPGAAPVSAAEEQARVLPVIRGLAAAGAVVSVDTRHAATMAAALAEGARIVNDVSALAHDPQASHVVAAARAPVVLMHMRGTPATMDGQARYADVARDVAEELAARIAAAEVAGVARADIAIDPGFGFAKNHAQNLDLLDRLALLLGLGCHVLAGVSRKRFIGQLAGEAEPARRDPGSLAAALAALDRGATLLRVHDVAGTAQAVRVWRGLHA